MTPIPEAALPVVEILRRDVPRPETLPGTLSMKPSGWCRPPLRFINLPGCPCPMGLHPDSITPCPGTEDAFAGGKCFYRSIYEFFHWWDDLGPDDAQAAVDAVWPPETKS